MDGRSQALARWTDAGLLTREQADAIDAWEDARRPSRHGRRALVAEAAGYAGAALAGSAGWLALSEYWADLETWARILLVATGTAFAAFGAWAVSAGRDDALRRLAAFLWAAAVLGVGVVVVLLTDEAAHLAGQNQLLLTGGVAAAAAAPLLWWRRTTLQALACLGATVVLVLGVVSQYDHVSNDVIGTALWGLGVCWTLLTLGGVVPVPRPALVAGPMVALVGAAVMVPDWTVGRWVGLATGAVLLVGAGVARVPVLAVAGLPGVFLFAGEIVAALATSEGEQRPTGVGWVLALVVVGLAVLAGAVVVARHDGAEGSSDG